MDDRSSLSAAELAALRFTLQARLALALGVTLACASKATLNSWAAVTAALASLSRALGWNVRSLSIVAGPARAAKQVEAALDGIEDYVRHREGERAHSDRANVIRRELAAVRVALDRARSSTERSAA
ncbi:MAG: hypothetical protein U0269_37750 [Polyangiales bacterium]